MTNYGWNVRDADDPSVLAYCKRVRPDKPLTSSLYSFGVERAVTELAREIAFPVPEVHLEEVEGEPGLVSLLVPGHAWYHLDDDTERSLRFVDRADWGAYMVFDLLVGNHDRHAKNIFVEWNPPGHKPEDGEHAVVWLIDYGWSGLWPVYKFGPNLGMSDLLNVNEDADLMDVYRYAIRNSAPPRYRTAFPMKGTPEREEAIARVRRITDELIDEVLDDVPATYIAEPARDLTSAWLRGRLARIVTLVDAVYPQ